MGKQDQPNPMLTLISSGVCSHTTPKKGTNLQLLTQKTLSAGGYRGSEGEGVSAVVQAGNWKPLQDMIKHTEKVVVATKRAGQKM